MRHPASKIADTSRMTSDLPSDAVSRRSLLALPLLLGAGLVHAQGDLTDLAKVQASGVLKVAVYKDNAPFSDGPAGDISGLDVSIAQALAAQLQLKLQLLPFDSGENMGDDLRNMVWRGHYLGYGPADVMLQVPADKYLMQENRQVVIVSPYMRQHTVVMHNTRQLAKIDGPEDLKGLALGAERGTGAASALMGNNGGMLRTQVKLFKTGVQAAQGALNGEVAAAYVLRAQAEAAMASEPAKAAGWQLSPLPLPGTPANGWPVGMAVKATNKDLGAAIQRAMQTLQSNGEMLAIFKKHGLTLTAP
ncbi:MAG: hypothetical protein RLZZ591_420 [Pseudomonadota bacterium]